jgi:two-component system, OmpR family, phosphate regulon sensor histidine kinase PhoR
MLELILLSFLLTGGGGFWLYSRCQRPWSRLEKLLEAIELDLAPPSFSIGSSDRLTRISRHLQKLSAHRQELARRLDEEAFNLQAILGTMTEGVMITDAQRSILQVNAEFLSLFRLKKVPLQQTVLAALREAPIELVLRDAVESGQPQHQLATLSLTGEDNVPFQVEIRAIPIKNESGQVRTIVAIFQDVSRLKQLEQVRREFVANVSHELKTPLSIFHGYVEMLLEDQPTSAAERKRIFEILQRNSRRLNFLLEDLLTIARLESRQITLEASPLNLESFLRQLAGDWQLKLAEKQLQLDLSFAPNLPALEADPVRLEQVFANLLDNAVKYSNSGGVVRLQAIVEGEEMVIRIADEGQGIPAADLPHIFERFYRVDKARTREQGGTGLGLSIVKHIIQVHGGTVLAQSEPEKGTTIILRLPLHQPDPA